jgi:hypothetical protein
MMEFHGGTVVDDDETTRGSVCAFIVNVRDQAWLVVHKAEAGAAKMRREALLFRILSRGILPPGNVYAANLPPQEISDDLSEKKIHRRRVQVVSHAEQMARFALGAIGSASERPGAALSVRIRGRSRSSRVRRHRAIAPIIKAPLAVSCNLRSTRPINGQCPAGHN